MRPPKPPSRRRKRVPSQHQWPRSQLLASDHIWHAHAPQSRGTSSLRSERTAGWSLTVIKKQAWVKAGLKTKARWRRWFHCGFIQCRSSLQTEVGDEWESFSFFEFRVSGNIVPWSRDGLACFFLEEKRRTIRLLSPNIQPIHTHSDPRVSGSRLITGLH